MLKLTEHVYILWWDTEDYKDKGWASTEEIHEFGKKVCDIHSTGWIVKKTRHYITICSDFSPDPDTHGRVMKIPRKMIKLIIPIPIPQTHETPSQP